MVCIVSREKQLSEQSRAVSHEGVQTVDTGRASCHTGRRRSTCRCECRVSGA